ncbi:MAG: GxxExxY protein [Lentisphaerales bacterium]|jgi:GxxExxY protein|nr:MAG: GxxExxY protein [Lentisphaerales bacterium]
MNTDRHGLLFEKETRRIIKCGMEVLNELGHGLLEKPYENALVVEFQLSGIPCEQQPRFEVTYKGTPVGDYVPDLIVFDEIVVDTKVVDHIGDHEVGQMINYLKITKLRVGLILNFKCAKLEWKRVVL